MIYSTRLTTTNPTIVFTSTTTGGPVGSAIPGLVATAAEQDNAITNIVICNTGTPDLTNENTNQATITIHLVNRLDLAPSDTNTIVKNLIVPAGETVFFSEDRVVLRGDSDYGADTIYVTSNQPNLISVTVSALPV
jgi:hypothetical protein